MSILRKRRKKSRLIEEIANSKAKHASSESGKRSNEERLYLARRKTFRLAVLYSTALLLTLWWVPLAGPILAGYLGGRKAGGRWVALRAALIPVIFIGVTANLVLLGILPRIDLGREIGIFFLAVSPGLYYSLAPGIIPVIAAFAAIHGALGLGANGYLIITVIMAYMGGMVSEKMEVLAELGSKKKSSKGAKSAGESSGDDGKFMFRKQRAQKSGFAKVADGIKKLGRAPAPVENYPANTSARTSKGRDGWVRKDKSAPADAGTDARTEGLPTASSNPRYTARHTVNSSSERTAGRQYRTISSGSVSQNGGSKVTDMHPRGNAPDGVDSVRRAQYVHKPAMSRAIIDRAVKSYHSEKGTKAPGSVEDSGDKCQMGMSHRQNEWDSL